MIGIWKHLGKLRKQNERPNQSQLSKPFALRATGSIVLYDLQMKMKAISDSSPFGAIVDGICCPIKGSIIALLSILLGFAFGTFLGLLPEIGINEIPETLVNCLWFSPLSFAASIIAVIAIPWSFLLKAGYTVSAIIFFTSDDTKTKIRMLPTMLVFAACDGILCTRFIQ